VEGLGWLDTALAEKAAESGDLRPARGRALADKALLLASVGVTESLEAAEQALTLARELRRSGPVGTGARVTRVY
jgi:hypothetical protein